MKSLIQKYKSLYSQLQDLRYKRSFLFIDYDLHVSDRKNYRLWLSTFHNETYKNKDVSHYRVRELPGMINKKTEKIAHYLERIKENKVAIKEVKKKLSNLQINLEDGR